MSAHVLNFDTISCARGDGERSEQVIANGQRSQDRKIRWSPPTKPALAIHRPRDKVDEVCWRRQMAVLSHDGFLFWGSFLENARTEHETRKSEASNYVVL
ncbi:uncharacterized protein SPSK_02069 [Sporothrix schenckii 1099-18]|uniref:Uncharacterized protein n=1 Tax=Sporothrix schenckii 1099-18 TaxID=1397361 RepID=A0A0F2MCU1_SPOSC|nr:uncharacterized protein SPSK_02069 [Sporothrix schenckii 1099-18]KJR87452.1 hypothetical protein SPSK_02069 [Sporothrix schenckii 1099-18]